jgi:UDP-N-acetylglucosamine acyltransferase
MAKIHSTALVDAKAQLADDVEVGPYCIVGPNVTLGPGCRLIAHAYVGGYTTMGRGNVVHPYAAIGTDPQDLKFKSGTKAWLRIGDGNTFREGFSGNIASDPDAETVIGSNCLFMANTHVAHNCRIGNRVIMVNGAVVGGYVSVGDCALLSGHTAVHQFCRVGRLAVISGVSAISIDLPPFMIEHGRNGPVQSVNLIGLQRNGFTDQEIRALKNVYKIFYRKKLTVKAAVAQIREEVPLLPPIQEFIDFVESSTRGVLCAKSFHARQY